MSPTSLSTMSSFKDTSSILSKKDSLTKVVVGSTEKKKAPSTLTSPPKIAAKKKCAVKHSVALLTRDNATMKSGYIASGTKNPSKGKITLEKISKSATDKSSAEGKATKKVSKKPIVSIPPLPEGIIPGVGAVGLKILASLAYMCSLGTTTPPRQLIAGLSGYINPRSASYLGATKELRSMELIDYPTGETVRLTDEGIAAVGSAAAHPCSNTDVQTRIKEMLSPKGAEIFEILCDGRAHDRSPLALSVGYKNPQASLCVVTVISLPIDRF